MTLSGKVLIINSLIASLLVYRMQVIHTLPERFVQDFNDIVNDFLWKGKRPKIPLQTLMVRSDQGGLGLVDVVAKHKSLLLTWIKHALTYDEISNLVETNLNYRNDVIWQANTMMSDCSNGGDFWSKIWHEWATFNYHDPQNRERVRDEWLWLNSHIKVDGKLLYDENLIDKGCKRISDILDEADNFISFNQFKLQFAPNYHWLDYFRIVTVTLQHWKFFVKKE